MSGPQQQGCCAASHTRGERTKIGAEIRQPLGYAMVGGLLVSQALTLFTTPVIYIYLDRLSMRLDTWFAGAGREEESRQQAVAAE